MKTPPHPDTPNMEQLKQEMIKRFILKLKIFMGLTLMIPVVGPIVFSLCQSGKWYGPLLIVSYVFLGLYLLGFSVVLLAHYLKKRRLAYLQALSIYPLEYFLEGDIAQLYALDESWKIAWTAKYATLAAKFKDPWFAFATFTRNKLRRTLGPQFLDLRHNKIYHGAAQDMGAAQPIEPPLAFTVQSDDRGFYLTYFEQDGREVEICRYLQRDVRGAHYWEVMTAIARWLTERTGIPFVEHSIEELACFVPATGEVTIIANHWLTYWIKVKNKLAASSHKVSTMEMAADLVVSQWQEIFKSLNIPISEVGLSSFYLVYLSLMFMIGPNIATGILFVLALYFALRCIWVRWRHPLLNKPVGNAFTLYITMIVIIVVPAVAAAPWYGSIALAVLSGFGCMVNWLWKRRRRHSDQQSSSQEMNTSI